MNIKCKENYAIIMIINVSNLFLIKKNLDLKKIIKLDFSNCLDLLILIQRFIYKGKSLAPLLKHEICIEIHLLIMI